MKIKTKKRLKMREEKYNCPDVDCGFTSFESGECPLCGLQLEKIKGEDYFAPTEEKDEGISEPIVNDFSDDPDDVSWYSDEPAGI
jgi:hypothetical protein